MKERFKLIKPYIENKTVLDIGCCGWYSHRRGPFELEGWLHNNIKKYAKSILGVDISKECIDFLNLKGYNVEIASAESFNLNKKFDVIVAGEIIEHISNFQGFFDSAKMHLEEDGLLILTTPNMFYFQPLLFLILKGDPGVHPEHVCWFDEITLRQLFDRFGFSILKTMYATEKYVRGQFDLKDMILQSIEKSIPFKKLKYNNIIMVAKKI